MQPKFRVPDRLGEVHYYESGQMTGAALTHATADTLNVERNRSLC